MNITVHEAIITGLSSLNSVRNCLLENGSFVSSIYIPSLNVTGNYSTVPEIHGVSRGTIRYISQFFIQASYSNRCDTYLWLTNFT